MTTTLQPVGSVLSQPGMCKPGGAGILQTQLSRYETQLADWCNCPGGKTAEGKKIITDLQQKADAVKAQIKQIEDARARGASSPPSAAGPSQPPADRAASTLGLRIDAYA